MEPTEGDPVFRKIRRWAGPESAEEMTDGDLVDRFAVEGHASAFSVLVRRHGPMVHRVCRRVLGDHHLAEDATQAAFLVLARKAASIRKRQSLASWLHGVAFRVAHKARRRANVHLPDGLEPMDRSRDNPEQDELSGVLDEEIQGLPEIYRSPVVLCYLEGRTNVEAAAAIGCPEGTVFGRLARARDRLRQCLERRGFALSSATLGLMLDGVATAACPAALLESVSDPNGIENHVSARAVALAQEVLNAMLWTKLARIGAGALLALLLIGGTYQIAHSMHSGNPDVAPVKDEKVAEKPAVLLEPLADPFKTGDDISLKLTLTNTGKAEAHYDIVKLRCLEGLSVVGPDKNAIAAEMLKKEVCFAEDKRALAPGASIVIELKAINSVEASRHIRFPMEKAGDYRVRMSVNGIESNEAVVRVVQPK